MYLAPMDTIEYSMPLNINMEHIERDISKPKDHIHQIDDLHMAEIQDWIESHLTSQMRINLFLREWEKVKKREIESLICKAQLQLEHAQYKDVVDLLDSFSKWQSTLGKY